MIPENISPSTLAQIGTLACQRIMTPSGMTPNLYVFLATDHAPIGTNRFPRPVKLYQHLVKHPVCLFYIYDYRHLYAPMLEALGWLHAAGEISCPQTAMDYYRKPIVLHSPCLSVIAYATKDVLRNSVATNVRLLSLGITSRNTAEPALDPDLVRTIEHWPKQNRIARIDSYASVLLDEFKIKIEAEVDYRGYLYTREPFLFRAWNTASKIATILAIAEGDYNVTIRELHVRTAIRLVEDSLRFWEVI